MQNCQNCVMADVMLRFGFLVREIQRPLSYVASDCDWIAFESGRFPLCVCAFEDRIVDMRSRERKRPSLLEVDPFCPFFCGREREKDRPCLKWTLSVLLGFSTQACFDVLAHDATRLLSPRTCSVSTFSGEIMMRPAHNETTRPHTCGLADPLLLLPAAARAGPLLS